MWKSTELTRKLGLDVPIIQAPMAGANTPALAATVANAGGLGSLGLGTISAKAGAAQIQAFQAASNRALNVNFFCHPDPGDVSGRAKTMRARLVDWYAEAGLDDVPEPQAPYTPFGPKQLALVEEHRPPVVSFHFGLPDANTLTRVRKTGALVFASATTVAEARVLDAAGIDAIIAQGTEAGGHRGTFLGAPPTTQPGLFSLLPQVAAAVTTPVIAAGGIATGRTIAAALMLGASAVQIGTAYLRCPEAAVDPHHQEALAKATDDGTRVTRLISGYPARSLRTRYVESMQDMEEEAAPYPTQLALHGPLKSGPTADPAAVLTMWSGQSAALTRALPAAELTALLIKETDAAFAAFHA